MLNRYKTIMNPAEAGFEEKRSRFIASVRPVSSEPEALEFINALKSKYWDATHNVYAYYIDGDNIIQRFSDDGEPSGTAGMPALEVIKRMEVRNLVVVVTRYFGGILLGASGLIRAYSKSTSLGIEAAGVVIRQLCIEAAIIIEYTLFGRLQSILLSQGYIIKDIIYGQDVEIIVFVQENALGQFEELVRESTNARAVVGLGEKTYITVDEKGKLLDKN